MRQPKDNNAFCASRAFTAALTERPFGICLATRNSSLLVCDDREVKEGGRGQAGTRAFGARHLLLPNLKEDKTSTAETGRTCRSVVGREKGEGHVQSAQGVFLDGLR